jgi:hypothetical protein
VCLGKYFLPNTFCASGQSRPDYPCHLGRLREVVFAESLVSCDHIIWASGHLGIWASGQKKPVSEILPRLRGGSGRMGNAQSALHSSLRRTCQAAPAHHSQPRDCLLCECGRSSCRNHSQQLTISHSSQRCLHHHCLPTHCPNTPRRCTLASLPDERCSSVRRPTHCREGCQWSKEAPGSRPMGVGIREKEETWKGERQGNKEDKGKQK